MRKDGTKYDVRYFGGSYERGIIDQKNIQPIETPIANLKVRRNAAWNDAYDELQKFLEIKLDPERVKDLPATRGKSGASKGDKSMQSYSILGPSSAAVCRMKIETIYGHLIRSIYRET